MVKKISYLTLLSIELIVIVHIGAVLFDLVFPDACEIVDLSIVRIGIISSAILLLVAIIGWYYENKTQSSPTIPLPIKLIFLLTPTLISFFSFYVESLGGNDASFYHGKFPAPFVDVNQHLYILLGPNSTTAHYKKIDNDIFETGKIDLHKELVLKDKKNKNVQWPVNLKLRQGEMFVDSELKDNDGKMIAQIVDNTFTMNYRCKYDRNYDNTAFEVVDRRMIPILQVAMIGENIVYIGGVIKVDNRIGIMTPKRFILDPTRQEQILYARRLFSYPSNENRGRREPLFGISEVVEHRVKEHKESIEASKRDYPQLFKKR